MTRRHFQAVARVVAGIKQPEVRRSVCLDAIRELRQFNSNFDRYRFERACDAEEDLMPSWWKDQAVSRFVGALDETLEVVGPSDELHGLLAAWEVELARLRELAGGERRVEVAESGD